MASCVLMSTVLLLKKSSISHYGTMLDILWLYILTTAGQIIDMIYFLRLCVIKVNQQFNNSAASLNIASLYCFALMKQNGRQKAQLRCTVPASLDFSGNIPVKHVRKLNDRKSHQLTHLALPLFLADLGRK